MQSCYFMFSKFLHIFQAMNLLDKNENHKKFNYIKNLHWNDKKYEEYPRTLSTTVHYNKYIEISKVQIVNSSMLFKWWNFDHRFTIDSHMNYIMGFLLWSSQCALYVEGCHNIKKVMERVLGFKVETQTIGGI